jgi:hypothetical protein
VADGSEVLRVTILRLGKLKGVPAVTVPNETATSVSVILTLIDVVPDSPTTPRTHQAGLRVKVSGVSELTVTMAKNPSSKVVNASSSVLGIEGCRLHLPRRTAKCAP